MIKLIKFLKKNSKSLRK